jgi:antitoxin component of MazEF toxin-antitoxin module
MIKRLQKIGNSSGLVIDRAILSLLKMDKDEEVEISINGKGITITPTRALRK